MPKFNVSVTVTATTSYEVQVEADSESEAEDIATSRDIAYANTPDFDIDLGEVTYETEATQLTFHCDECRKAISEAQYRALDNMCPTCHARVLQEDIDFWNATPARIHESFTRVLKNAVAAGAQIFDPKTRRQWRVTA